MAGYGRLPKSGQATSNGLAAKKPISTLCFSNPTIKNFGTSDVGRNLIAVLLACTPTSEGQAIQSKESLLSDHRNSLHCYTFDVWRLQQCSLTHHMPSKFTYQVLRLKASSSQKVLHPRKGIVGRRALSLVLEGSCGFLRVVWVSKRRSKHNHVGDWWTPKLFNLASSMIPH
jgi:hypothetical protein